MCDSNGTNDPTTYDLEEAWRDDQGCLPSCTASLQSHLEEPHGAGADPFDRPDPRTSPEAWSE